MKPILNKTGLPSQFLSEEEARQKQERQSLQESHENQLKAVQEQCDASAAELQQLQVSPSTWEQPCSVFMLRECGSQCLCLDFRMRSSKFLWTWRRKRSKLWRMNTLWSSTNGEISLHVEKRYWREL